jgi:hypothetical protein
MLSCVYYIALLYNIINKKKCIVYSIRIFTLMNDEIFYQLNYFLTISF